MTVPTFGIQKDKTNLGSIQLRKAAILVDMLWSDIIVFLQGVCFYKSKIADSLFTILSPALV